LDLDQLTTQIGSAIEASGMVTFHGVSRIGDDDHLILWDTDRVPDFREFLLCAGRLGAKVIVYHERKFIAEPIDDLREELQESDLTPPERREFERRLKALRDYVGFTAGIELSFDYNDSVYLYEVRSDFMNELLGIMSELDNGYLDDAGEDDDDSGGTPRPSGFFSRN
jgi:hypothetical protein